MNYILIVHSCLTACKSVNHMAVELQYQTFLYFITWRRVTFRSSTAHSCSDCRLKLIGRLKSHGVWACVTGGEQVVLFHLIRAQEQMLFARMMARHALPVENFQQPVKLDVGCVFALIIMSTFL